MIPDLPALIGSFKLLKELGRGPCSLVYLAQPDQTEQVPVIALKLLRVSAMCSHRSLKQFMHTARAVAELEHPHLIQFYKIADESEPPFLAMEYIAGSLQQQLNQRLLPWAEIIPLIKHIGAALSYAHAHQLIHANLKPRNILLDATQQPVRPVLTDFGWTEMWPHRSFISGAPPPPTPPLGEAYGYLAPEQWEQRHAPVPATDVYALALILFEILAGQPPFAANTIAELKQKHLHEPAPPLSKVAYKIGPFFDRVLLKATAKDPAERYPEVAPFIEELEAAMTEAEQAERTVRHRRAIQAVKLARGYLNKETYNLEQATNLAETALASNPAYIEARRLRGQIKLKGEQFAEALEDYRQAFEQEQNLASAAGLDYLRALRQAAETFWQRRTNWEAVKYYRLIKQILDTGQAKGEPVQAWQEVWTELVERHYHAGLKAYAEGNPENMENAIKILERERQALEALQADLESRDLRDKSKFLKIKQYEEIIRVEEGAIETINAQPDSIRYNDDTSLQHYFNLAETYQKLIELEPDNQQWQELKEKAELERQYYQIQKLLYQQAYQQALDQLIEDFINTSQHEYRDVSKLLWGLVYAKQNEGKFPPEWIEPAAEEEPAKIEPEPQPQVERSIRFNYLVFIIQALIILTSILIGILLERIVGGILF